MAVLYKTFFDKYVLGISNGFRVRITGILATGNSFSASVRRIEKYLNQLVAVMVPNETMLLLLPIGRRQQVLFL